MGVVGATLEFWVELASDKVWVRRDLDQFDQVFFGIETGDLQPALGHPVAVGVVEFVPVPVPLAD